MHRVVLSELAVPSASAPQERHGGEERPVTRSRERCTAMLEALVGAVAFVGPTLVPIAGALWLWNLHLLLR